MWVMEKKVNLHSALKYLKKSVNLRIHNICVNSQNKYFLKNFSNGGTLRGGHTNRVNNTNYKNVYYFSHGENRATMHYFWIFRALCDEMTLPLLSYVFETRVLNSMNVLLVVILIFSCWIFYDLISSFIQRMEFSENMWGIYIENCRKMERVILCRNLFHSTKLFVHTSLICID